MRLFSPGLGMVVGGQATITVKSPASPRWLHQSLNFKAKVGSDLSWARPNRLQRYRYAPMAKQRFDESKVTRGPDGRFLAQAGGGYDHALQQQLLQQESQRRIYDPTQGFQLLQQEAQRRLHDSAEQQRLLLQQSQQRLHNPAAHQQLLRQESKRTLYDANSIRRQLEKAMRK